MKSKKYSKNVSGKVMHTQIVFHTKYNRNMLKGEIQRRAMKIIYDILRENGCSEIAIGVYPNHVRLLFAYPPTLAIAKLMGRVKGKSSYLLRKEFPELEKQCPKALWAPKYGMVY
ncbi:MAG: IS200/IS605 family transposase [Thermoplasmata archaeon]|nr:MAG: IS200/IS605 family transposase [Thermoplasmata archaeon]